MEVHMYSLLILITLTTVICTSPPPQEFCQFETFNATCPSDSVIVIKSAKYGRMRGDSRCITGSSSESINCYSDVIVQADARCSGRRHCSIAIPDKELHQHQPCRQELFSYMEASYECVKVEQGQSRHCGAYKPLIAESTSGYLSSLVTGESRVGSGECPWLVRVPAGQRINVSLLDFSRDRHNDQSTCSIYATIKENGRQPERDVTLCQSTERIKEIYQSEGNEIQIHIGAQNTNGPRRHYLFHYKAFGCTDLHPTPDQWLTRIGNALTVGCNKTNDKWHLVCRGNQWVGEYGNCSSAGRAGSGGHAAADNSSPFPFGLIISIILGVVLGVVIGFSMLMFVLAFRKWRVKKAQRAQLYKQAHYGHSPDYVGSTMPGAAGGGYAPSGETLVTAPPCGISRQQSMKATRDQTRVYESPKFGRKEYVDGVMLPYYHEFEPHLYDGNGREAGCLGGVECGHIHPVSARRATPDS